MRRHFNVSLAVLVPLILGGVAALAVLCAGFLPQFFPGLRKAGDAMVPALAAGLSVAAVSATFV